MLWNGTDCWRWQQLSKSNHVRDAIVKLLLRLLIYKLVLCSRKMNLEFILRATSHIKQAMYSKEKRGRAIKSHFPSCSAIFFWSTERYWPNLYMSMDKSQGVSYPAKPAIDGSSMRQSRMMISQISYDHVTLSSDVKMKTMQHETKGCSHVWFLAQNTVRWMCLERGSCLWNTWDFRLSLVFNSFFQCSRSGTRMVEEERCDLSKGHPASWQRWVKLAASAGGFSPASPSCALTPVLRKGKRWMGLHYYWTPISVKFDFLLTSYESPGSKPDIALK